MDCRIYQRMRNLPTKQNPHALEKGSPILHRHQRRGATLQTYCNGPDHQTTPKAWQKHNPHYRQPQMFISSNIPLLQQHHHRAWHCPTIPGSCLQMVQTSHKDN
jgi:hypothetical protein